VTAVVVVAVCLAVVVGLASVVVLALRVRRRRLSWIMNEMLTVEQHRLARARCEQELAAASLELDGLRRRLCAGEERR
jgi:hypothetical protein